MKRFMALLLALALLLCAASGSAESGGGFRDRLDKIRSQGGAERMKWDETEEHMRHKAATDQVMTLLENGDAASLKAMVHNQVRIDKVDTFISVVLGYGSMDSWEMIDYTADAQSGWCTARYLVVHGSGQYHYDITVDADDKVTNLNTSSAKQVSDLPASEIDPDTDYAALGCEYMDMLIAGEYTAVLDKVMPDAFAGVDEAQFDRIARMYGDAQFYVFYNAQVQSGYVQMVFEVCQSNGLAFWQLVMTGSGELAGFHVSGKMQQREEMTDEEMRAAADCAKAFLAMLRGREIEALSEAIAPQVREELGLELLTQMYGYIDGRDTDALHDMYKVGEYTGVDILLGDAQDVMLRFVLDADGAIYGVQVRDVVHISPADE